MVAAPARRQTAAPRLAVPFDASCASLRATNVESDSTSDGRTRGQRHPPHPRFQTWVYRSAPAPRSIRERVCSSSEGAASGAALLPRPTPYAFPRQRHNVKSRSSAQVQASAEHTLPCAADPA